MRIKLNLLLKKLFSKLLKGTKRFPQAILMAAAAAIIMISFNHLGINYNRATADLLKRIALILALGVPLFLNMVIFFERVPKLKPLIKITIQLVGAAVLLLYFFFFFNDLSFVSTTRYTAFIVMLFLIFIFIPQLHNKENYEMYLILLLKRFIITYFYSFVLYGGLSAILFTITKLFSVHISEKLYLDILIIIAGFFAPVFFLADIPECEKKFDTSDYPKFLKVLLLYIIMPIISIYTAIVYVYFGKVIITKHWPDGIISNLVFWYSIICTGTIFFAYPLKDTSRWCKVFILIFSKLTIPLLIMMFISMGIRINAYGITEKRYYVLVIGLWITGCMIYFNTAKSVRSIVLPITLALITLLSVIGSWSSYSVSMYSQNLRFEEILKRNNMIKNGLLTKASNEISDNDKKEISSIVRYFDNYHSFRELKYVPESFNLNKMNNAFGFPMYYDMKEYNKNNYFNHTLEGDDSLFNIKDYDYFLDISNYKPSDIDTSDGTIKITYAFQNGALKIMHKNKIIYNKNVKDIASKIHNDNYNNRDFPLSKNQMTFYDSNENVDVVYIFRQISGSGDPFSENINIESLQFTIFIKLK